MSYGPRSEFAKSSRRGMRDQGPGSRWDEDENADVDDDDADEG